MAQIWQVFGKRRNRDTASRSGFPKREFLSPTSVFFGRKQFQRSGIMFWVFSLALSLGGMGCSWTDKSGTHHLIVGVGFGILTSTNRPGVEVRDSHVLGGEFGPEGVGLGWMQHHRTLIDPAIASNVVVAVKASHLGITVKNFDPYSNNTNFNQGKNYKPSK